MANAEKLVSRYPLRWWPLSAAQLNPATTHPTSEVVRDALREWTHKRSLRQQEVAELRDLWRAALRDPTPGVAADEVLDRLERKYQAIADAANTAE